MLKIGDRVMWRGSWGDDAPVETSVESIDINREAKHGDAVNEVPWAEVNDRSVIVVLSNEHWAYGTQIKEIMVPDGEKIVGFDFDMDSFVSVQAPLGTDPDTLHARAIELFKERLASGDAVVKFVEIFDED